MVIPFESWVIPSENITKRAAFGDIFGVVNTLFSGLAFAGVIYAVLLQKEELRYQRKELGLQRKELKLTREELHRTAEAQEAQASISTNLLEIEAVRRRLEYEKMKRDLDLDLDLHIWIIVYKKKVYDDGPNDGPKLYHRLMLILDNRGGPVRDVKVETSDERIVVVDFDREERWYPVLGTLDLKYYFENESKPLQHFQITAMYRNRLGNDRPKSFSIVINRDHDIISNDENRKGTWIRAIDAVDERHPNHLNEIGQYIPDSWS